MSTTKQEPNTGKLTPGDASVTLTGTPKLSSTYLNPNKDLQPFEHEGRLYLRFCPKPSPVRGAAVSCGPSDAPRRLSTGCRLRVPAGFAALVCQVEEQNGRQRYSGGELHFGETDEVEVAYRATQHHYVSPGRVVGCVLLIPAPTYAVEEVKP